MNLAIATATGNSLELVPRIWGRQIERINASSASLFVMKHQEQAGNSSTSLTGGAVFPSAEVRPDRLLSAMFDGRASLKLRFADKSFRLPVSRLEMPIDRIQWHTAKASPTGEKLTLKGVKGDDVPIDTETLRYLVDPDFAAKMDETLKSLQFTDEELEQLDLDEPPQGFLGQPDIDLTRESWK